MLGARHLRLQDRLAEELEPEILIRNRRVREHEPNEFLLLVRRVRRCAIAGMPETHATRDFAKRYSSHTVHLCFFSETQRGQANWHGGEHRVDVNRTEALDASRAIIRDKQVHLPPRSPLVDEFARHMAADAKILEEDPDTGAKKYRYVRTGEDHFSLAFTHGLMALESMSMQSRHT